MPEIVNRDRRFPSALQILSRERRGEDLDLLVGYGCTWKECKRLIRAKVKACALSGSIPHLWPMVSVHSSNKGVAGKQKTGASSGERWGSRWTRSHRFCVASLTPAPVPTVHSVPSPPPATLNYADSIACVTQKQVSKWLGFRHLCVCVCVWPLSLLF